MPAIQHRITHILLALVLVALLAIIAMMATGVRGGPLDPTTTPASTDSVKLPGTPISSAPITITQPGHYYLTRNLNVTGAVTAITIDASNVSLDLGGFTIAGNNKTVGSFGIAVAGAESDIEISRGLVRDFHFGLLLSSGERVVVDAVRAVSNVRGMEIGSFALVTDCVSSHNTETGIYVPGQRTTIRNCEVYWNATGITLAGEGYHTVERSQIRANDLIVAGPSHWNVVRDNIVEWIFLQAEAGETTVTRNVCLQGAIQNNSGEVSFIPTATTPHGNFNCGV